MFYEGCISFTALDISTLFLFASALVRQNKKNVRNDGGEVPGIVIVFVIVVVRAVDVIEIRMLYVSSPIMLFSISSLSIMCFYSLF